MFCRLAVRTSNFVLRNSQFVLSALSFVGFFCFVTSGCGYRLAGKATAIPANIDSVAIPIFDNKTTKYRLEQRLTSAVVDEFVARTRYRIVPDASQAKAFLQVKLSNSLQHLSSSQAAPVPRFSSRFACAS